MYEMTEVICGTASTVGKEDFSNTEEPEDRIPDTDAVDLRYGCGGARPAWLQWLNNIVGVVTLFCAANFMLNFTNGLVGVVLSTIERRFDLTSSQSSWIAAGYEFGPIPILILISIFGNRSARKFTIIPVLHNNNNNDNKLVFFSLMSITFGNRVPRAVKIIIIIIINFISDNT